MTHRARRTQLLFLLLLGISATQVLWWIFDQSQVSREMAQRQVESWQSQVQAAELLAEKGVDPARVVEAFPALEFRGGGSEAGASFAARPELLLELEGERGSHTRQYLFEGMFFLGVLAIAMLVLGRFLKQEADLARQQSNFLAAVSHELKSPLASLRLTNETLSRRAIDDQKRRQLTQRSREDLERLERLISNLLDSSRVEQGALALKAETISLRELVDQAIVDLALDGSRVDVDLDVQVPADLRIEADPVAASTVLRNLLQNAVEACRVAEVSPRIEIRAERSGRFLKVRVEDNGIGFEGEESERLFEKFYRTGDEMTRSKKGTGLGLYLVRRFVELDGGRVKASSRGLGNGASFEVDWPIAESLPAGTS